MNFQRERRLKSKGLCPWCEKEINPNTEFKDADSYKEYKLSGLCQKCQDDFFDTGE